MFNNKPEVEMTHLYVPVEFANKYKELDDTKKQKQLAIEHVEQRKIDLKSELAQLDDDTVRFKASCLAHKDALEDVYKDQSSKLEKLINECWDVMPIAKKNAQKMADELQPFADKLTDIECSMNKIKKLSGNVNFYGIENIIKLADQLNTMDDKTKDILSFMVKNFNRG